MQSLPGYIAWDMGWLAYLQWPALAVTVLASWMVSLKQKNQRKTGFWVFLLSNILWGIWGVYAQAYALIALQVCLSVSNIHGIVSNRTKPADSAIADTCTRPTNNATENAA